MKYAVSISNDHSSGSGGDVNPTCSTDDFMYVKVEVANCTYNTKKSYSVIFPISISLNMQSFIT